MTMLTMTDDDDVDKNNDDNMDDRDYYRLDSDNDMQLVYRSVGVIVYVETI